MPDNILPPTRKRYCGLFSHKPSLADFFHIRLNPNAMQKLIPGEQWYHIIQIGFFDDVLLLHFSIVRPSRLMNHFAYWFTDAEDSESGIEQ